MSLSGKSIGLTGPLDGISRAEFRRMISDAGGSYSATLDDSVDILVIGERPLSSRVDQANSMDIEVIDQPAFQALLAGGPAPSSDPDFSGEDVVSSRGM